MRQDRFRFLMRCLPLAPVPYLLTVSATMGDAPKTVSSYIVNQFLKVDDTHPLFLPCIVVIRAIWWAAFPLIALGHALYVDRSSQVWRTARLL